MMTSSREGGFVTRPRRAIFQIIQVPTAPANVLSTSLRMAYRGGRITHVTLWHCHSCSDVGPLRRYLPLKSADFVHHTSSGLRFPQPPEAQVTNNRAWLA